MIDILDKLQNVDGFVRLVLKTGEVMFGHPDCIVWDEDAEGYDTIKTIRFEPYFSRFAVYFKVDEVESYDEYDEDEIPPAE